MTEGLIVQKKEIVARLSAAIGITRALQMLPGRPSLIILNYHRIGDASRTPYDSGTFSSTPKVLDEQLSYLKSRLRILNLDEALSIIHGETQLSQPSGLLTFDDGYLDNYQEAFPVLLRHGLSATFFLPTAFIGTNALPWWDMIAYVVKNSAKDHICFDAPEPVSFDISAANQRTSIRGILNLFKRPSVTDTEAFICNLEEACESSRPAGCAERCFLDWEEAREMKRRGMSFGSHTHSHTILSKLAPEEQVRELQMSRDIMETELNHSVDTLAYPVGHPDSFSPETKDGLRTAKYRTAFSSYAGVNYPGSIQPFDVLRFGVDGESLALFRLRLEARIATGRDLF